MLEGKNIILRAMEPKDIDLLYDWENHQELWSITGVNMPISRFDLEQYVLNNENDFFNLKQLRLMIEDKKSQKTIGSIDLFDFSVRHLRAELGILIVEEFRKKGMADESLKSFIPYVKKYLGLHQLYSTIPSTNISSIRLFEKNGFERVGVKKDWIKEGEVWMDLVLMQLIF